MSKGDVYVKELIELESIGLMMCPTEPQDREEVEQAYRKMARTRSTVIYLAFGVMLCSMIYVGISAELEGKRDIAITIFSMFVFTAPVMIFLGRVMTRMFKAEIDFLDEDGWHDNTMLMMEHIPPVGKAILPLVVLLLVLTILDGINLESLPMVVILLLGGLAFFWTDKVFIHFPYDLRRFFSLPFEEAQSLLWVSERSLMENVETEHGKEKMIIRNEKATPTIKRSTARSIRAKVTTMFEDREYNRLLRRCLAVILEGRPLPQAVAEGG